MPGRESIEIEIFGMAGVPPGMKPGAQTFGAYPPSAEHQHTQETHPDEQAAGGGLQSAEAAYSCARAPSAPAGHLAHSTVQLRQGVQHLTQAMKTKMMKGSQIRRQGRKGMSQTGTGGLRPHQGWLPTQAILTQECHHPITTQACPLPTI